MPCGADNGVAGAAARRAAGWACRARAPRAAGARAASCGEGVGCGWRISIQPALATHRATSSSGHVHAGAFAPISIEGALFRDLLSA